MIKELKWDSNFFGRKIGQLFLSENSIFNIDNDLEIARQEGFQYLICKIHYQDTKLIKDICSFGFYLSDIGIILSVPVEIFSDYDKDLEHIIVAEYNHIPELIKLSKSLFKKGRFYDDPFFTEEEADKLYNKWIENCVRGEAADIVFYIPEKGFIACKQENINGWIVLIGVFKEFQRKGVGRILVKKAVRWCKNNNVKYLKVRTQLKNIEAMNFYTNLGFRVEAYDLIFSKVL